MPTRRKNSDKNSRLFSPSWDSAAHTLFWQGAAAHHFRKEAPDQELILDEFQNAGWPSFLEISDLENNRTISKKRLRITVMNLNTSLKDAVHFRLEGSGRRICWEPA